MNPTNIYSAYFAVGQQYAALIRPYALTLVGSLILLEIATISITYMLGDSDNPPAVLWSIVRLAFSGGFSFWWLVNAWTLAVTVVGSFDQLGQNLTGIPNLTPMQFLETGSSIAKIIWSSPASSRLIPDLGAVLEQVGLCFGIFIIFVLIGVLVVVTLAAFYLITGPGSMLLAFMPCRFTSAMAENYFTWLIRTGVMVMFFYVVLGTAQIFALQYNTTLTSICKPALSPGPMAVLGSAPLSVSAVKCTNPIPTDELLQIFLDMAILAGICGAIPFIAGALVSHGVNMTLEHLASAKYLSGSTVKTLSNAVGGLAHQVSKLAQHMHQSSTLNSRMAAGAAAAARSAPTPPLGPSPSSSPPAGGWNGRPAGPPIAPPPNGGSGSGGAQLMYIPGRPGAQTKAKAIDITKLQKR
jgi:TrbL/VirB6 plasmid conjugal transfer protein